MKVHQVLGLPKPDESKHPHSMVLSRKGYVSVYDPDRRVPLVVSWTTTPADLRTPEQAPNVRSNAFHEDTFLPRNVPRATLSDYRNSGFDRGHMVRQSERPLGLDAHANEATYSLVNVLPQSRSNNAGAWAHLEDFYKDQITLGNKTAYVQAGPIFDGPEKTIGSGVAVPSHTYKIVVLADEGVDLKSIQKGDIGTRVKVMGVIIPNNDRDVKLGDHWARFVVPVSTIAERTQHDGFLAGLPTEARQAALTRRPAIQTVPKAEGTGYLVDGLFARAWAPKTSRTEGNEAN